MGFYKDGELNDKRVIEALNKAIEDYKDGELIEVRDTLLEIINAIDDLN